MPSDSVPNDRMYSASAAPLRLASRRELLQIPSTSCRSGRQLLVVPAMPGSATGIGRRSAHEARWATRWPPAQRGDVPHTERLAYPSPQPRPGRLAHRAATTCGSGRHDAPAQHREYGWGAKRHPAKRVRAGATTPHAAPSQRATPPRGSGGHNAPACRASTGGRQYITPNASRHPHS